jgi:hypothetical protein
VSVHQLRPGTRGSRPVPLTTATQIRAVFSHPALYELGALLPGPAGVGRPARHPGYMLLAYGVLARLLRSANKVTAELREPHIWALITTTIAEATARWGEELVPPHAATPPDWDAFRYARDTHLTDPALLAELQKLFTTLAVDQAQQMGLLDPAGGGSLCHPDATRTVYGDGTVVRPLYRPPTATRTKDPLTGKVTITYLADDGTQTDEPTRRFDPDAAEHHGHTGSVHGQNYVGTYVRGPGHHQRVVLSVDRVPRPGLEADTAVTALTRVRKAAGTGMQAVVYDGALRGTHLDHLMRTHGLVVINKTHGSRTATRWFTLGTWEHDTPDGPCTHTLAAIDGAVTETGIDDAGDPVALHRLLRRQVKRPRRASGQYHFSVGYEVPCPHGVFLAWVTPHADTADRHHRRADAIRIIAAGEDDFTRLYSLRNDSESTNSQFKRTLLVDRAMASAAPASSWTSSASPFCTTPSPSTTPATRTPPPPGISGSSKQPENAVADQPTVGARAAWAGCPARRRPRGLTRSSPNKRRGTATPSSATQAAWSPPPSVVAEPRTLVDVDRTPGRRTPGGPEPWSSSGSRCRLWPTSRSCGAAGTPSGLGRAGLGRGYARAGERNSTTPELRRLRGRHGETPLRDDPRLRTGVRETGSGSKPGQAPWRETGRATMRRVLAGRRGRRGAWVRS